MIADRDSWKTPKKFWEMLNDSYKFTFDACAIEANTKCFDFSDDFETIEKNFLKNHVVWMNPPFSKAEAMFKHFFKVVNRGMAIYRCDNMETKVWQDTILPHASWIWIPTGRVYYEGQNGAGARFPSAIIGYNIPAIRTLRSGNTLQVTFRKRSDSGDKDEK